MSELKTSKEWQELDDSGVVILDPDGWDRSNYEYSFNEELITQQEYFNRRMMSTCKYPKDFFHNVDIEKNSGGGCATY